MGAQLARHTIPLFGRCKSWQPLLMIWLAQLSHTTDTPPLYGPHTQAILCTFLEKFYFF